VKPRDTGNVVNLMDALSLNDVGKGGASQPAKGRKAKKAASGQRGMLMAISGKGEAKAKGAAVGNSTGMSPGFSPFRILSTESAPRRKYADMSGPYEAKPPSSGKALLLRHANPRRWVW
jgi:hypothetical protein